MAVSGVWGGNVCILDIISSNLRCFVAIPSKCSIRFLCFNHYPGEIILTSIIIKAA